MGALLGAIYFAAYLGLRTVDPREYGWVMNGRDIRIEYSGWQFFRIEPWQFPPGRISGLLHPVGTSIANMDSIPLLALALKPFSALLSPDFQYFGAWHLLCLTLQGGFAALLLSLSGAVWPFQIFATALFLWNPLAMPSGDNPALAGAAWMSLAGFWIYFRPLGETTRRRELAAWLLLGGAAAGTNTYVCVMVLAIAAAFFTRRCWPDRVLSPAAAALHLCAVILLVVAVWWLEGYFVVGRYGDLLAGQLGHWSMNLLAPVNPMGWSSVLSNVPTATDGQYEGFAYFGLGILVLAPAALLSLVIRPPRRSELLSVAPLLLAGAVLTIVAVSPTVTLGREVLIELPRILYAPFAPFRASGRFVQPVFYLMFFLVLRRVARHLSARMATAVVVAVLALEIADIGPRLDHIARANNREARYAWRQPLDWESWRFVADGNRRMIIVPKGWDSDTKAAFIWLAGRAGLPINAGEPSRVDMNALYKVNQALQRQLASGRLDPATVYMVHPAQIDAFLSLHGDQVACRTVDGYHACATVDGG
jgi:hypothetical protein